jgi:hypothetical protein
MSRVNKAYYDKLLTMNIIGPQCQKILSALEGRVFETSNLVYEVTIK